VDHGPKARPERLRSGQSPAEPAAERDAAEASSPVRRSAACDMVVTAPLDLVERGGEQLGELEVRPGDERPERLARHQQRPREGLGRCRGVRRGRCRRRGCRGTGRRRSAARSGRARARRCARCSRRVQRPGPRLGPRWTTRRMCRCRERGAGFAPGSRSRAARRCAHSPPGVVRLPRPARREAPRRRAGQPGW